MAWDETSKQQHKCPCGLGTYTTRFFTDDWFRSEERWEMDCPACRQQYQLYSYYYSDSGLSCKDYIWVLKTSYAKIQVMQAQLSTSKSDAINSAMDRYITRWLHYFSDAKTKKEIWRRLTNNGEAYPSLSAFYEHTKHQEMEIYLKREFNYDNLPYIMGKINIEDEELVDRLISIKSMEEELEKATRQLMRGGYR